MPRLEQALVELSQRGEAIGPDRLLDRVEQNLVRDRYPVVVALDTEQSSQQGVSRRLRGPLVATAVVAAAVALLVVAVVPIGTESPPVGSPTDPVPESKPLMHEFVTALQAGDAEVAQARLASDSLRLLEFMTALDTSGIELFHCDYTAFRVSCLTNLGPDHFFTRLGVSEPLRFTARVDNEQLASPQWHLGTSIHRADAAFQTWVVGTHPELADRMWRSSGLQLREIELSAESGQTRMLLLDEYLDSLVAGLVTALRTGDVEAARDVMADPIGLMEFLIALDTSGVDFYNCESGSVVRYFADGGTQATVTCQADWGPDFYFQRLLETGPLTTFSAHVVDGMLDISDTWWPFGQPHLEVDWEFRDWVKETYPELVDVMWSYFGPGGGRGMVLSAESGRMRMRLIDEYLASR